MAQQQAATDRRARRHGGFLTHNFQDCTLPVDYGYFMTRPLGRHGPLAVADGLLHGLARFGDTSLNQRLCRCREGVRRRHTRRLHPPRQSQRAWWELVRGGSWPASAVSPPAPRMVRAGPGSYDEPGPRFRAACPDQMSGTDDRERVWRFVDDTGQHRSDCGPGHTALRGHHPLHHHIMPSAGARPTGVGATGCDGASEFTTE